MQDDNKHSGQRFDENESKSIRMYESEIQWLVRIIVDLDETEVYEIIAVNYKITLLEIKLIIFEIANYLDFHSNSRNGESISESMRYSYDNVNFFNKSCKFYYIKDNEIIPSVSSINEKYCIKFGYYNDFLIEYNVKENYKRQISNGIICPLKAVQANGNINNNLTNLGDEKEKDTTTTNKSDNESICPLIKQFEALMISSCNNDNNTNYNYNNEHNYQDMMDHLTSYTHSEVINRCCKQGVDCISYKKLCQSSNTISDMDKIHILLFKHPPRRRHDVTLIIAGVQKLKLDHDYNNIDSNNVNNTTNTNCNNNANINANNNANINANNAHINADNNANTNQRSDDQRVTFEYDPKFDVLSQAWDLYDKHGLPHQPPGKILNLLIGEVLTNGYENDLLPYDDDDESNHYGKYRIFEILQKKMDHRQHKKMGYPLQEYEMLSIILYTRCDCNYDMTRSQLENDFDKWVVFDFCLASAIDTLSIHENYANSTNIYSGGCGIQIDEKTGFAQSDIVDVFFKSYQSFSLDIQVAKEFSGSDGVIFALNVTKLLTGKDGKKSKFFTCADVSWISNNPLEKEILVTRGRRITLNKNKICYKQGKQLVIADNHSNFDIF